MSQRMPGNPITRAKRCPASDNEIIEVRQVQEFSDFPADVQQAASNFPELQAQSGKGSGA